MNHKRRREMNPAPSVNLNKVIMSNELIKREGAG
jgi:hypothetical protein